MRELPSGTVTFLFTDIEGSTKLLHELGDAYAEALAEHRRGLRAAFEAHGGVEVDTQGDAFFVAFARARDALAAAREGQQALADGPIRVRMGLHTGEPIVTEEGYVGIDVHRAARIAAVGHGGQVLVSQSTRELAGADGCTTSASTGSRTSTTRSRSSSSANWPFRRSRRSPTPISRGPRARSWAGRVKRPR